ncbi:hypothetical protein SLEP1_g17282 [Rubroshorea leprosula]|uniref:Uncharacterized protein n=1 Tax=Rubroshorea leprosula TaxID=152421 RepID=A0AAV5J496_9ROSI|nr:hypothetical protein SLEP1_g17282 [Rubroshorea leprosula]
MEAKRNCSSIPGEMEEEEEEKVLKRRISTHPLYGRLVQNHLDCLKVGGVGMSIADQRNQRIIKVQSKADYSPCSSMLKQSELDIFMEAYCTALSKLKEAMEEPQQETIAFISSMHSQLRELTTANNPQPADAVFAAEMTDFKWSDDQQNAD